MKQDGVVLRGAQAMLLEPFSAEQMESLETMLQNGFECKVLAVTKKAVVEARLNPNGKVRDVAANRIISAVEPPDTALYRASLQARRVPARQGRDPGAL